MPQQVKAGDDYEEVKEQNIINSELFNKEDELPLGKLIKVNRKFSLSICKYNRNKRF